MSLRQRWKFKRGADWFGNKLGSERGKDGEDQAEKPRSRPERRNQMARLPTVVRPCRTHQLSEALYRFAGEQNRRSEADRACPEHQALRTLNPLKRKITHRDDGWRPNPLDAAHAAPSGVAIPVAPVDRLRSDVLGRPPWL